MVRARGLPSSSQHLAGADFALSCYPACARPWGHHHYTICKEYAMEHQNTGDTANQAASAMRDAVRDPGQPRIKPRDKLGRP